MKSYLSDVRWINQQLETKKKQKIDIEKLKKKAFSKIRV